MSDFQAGCEIQKIVKNGPTMLFLGRNGQKELTETILQQRWSCIYSTAYSSDIQYAFHIPEQRIPFVVEDTDHIRDIKLNRRDLPIVFPFGQEPADVSSITPGENVKRESKARTMMMIIPELLTNSFGTLFVVGYDSTDPNELPLKMLYEMCLDMKLQSVYFFQCNCLNDPLVQELVISKVIQICNKPLREYFEPYNEDDLNNLYVEPEQGHTVFINGKQVSVPREVVFYVEGFADILTLDDMRPINIPHYMRPQWFYTFLKNSEQKPQWFGYDHGLYLHRYYFNLLYSLVDKRLAGKHLEGSEQNYQAYIKGKSKTNLPVLVAAQTSNSKTIALSYLAYKIFHDQKYPVIYIKNPDLNLTYGSDSFSALDALIKVLEDLGASQILLVWDSSLHSSQNASVKRLHTDLINRGRNVLIVSSSYELSEETIEKGKVYYTQTIPDDEAEYSESIICANGFLVMRPRIQLYAKERAELLDLVAENADINKEQVANWISRQNERNLLALLYALIFDLQPKIQGGLWLEVGKSIEYAQDAMTSILEPKSQISLMEYRLKQAGFQIENNNGQPKQAITETLQDFCTCIAIASQVKVPLTMSLALRFLKIPITSEYHKLFNVFQNMSFLLITTSSGDDDSFDYLISFRTPVEAELYLSKLNVTAEKRIQYVVDMIKAVCYTKGKDYDYEISLLDRLIRYIGPNSNQEHVVRDYQSAYPALIDALGELREEGVLEAGLISQEVTLIREVYGKASHMDEPAQPHALVVSDKVNWLIKAIDIARATIKGLQNRRDGYARRIINRLIVESTFSEISLRKLRKKYKQDTQKDLSIALDYQERYRLLKEVIAHEPSNTFPYVALLNLFIAEYNEPGVNDATKVIYLSDIIQIIDDVDSNSIEEVLELQEFNQSRLEIEGYVCEERYNKYFDELLARGRADGIHLKARCLFVQGGLNNNEPLSTPEQRKTCDEILELLNQYPEITDDHQSCLFMKIRLAWLKYNDAPIFSGEERQLTRMTKAQWREINTLCVKYERRFLSSNFSSYNANTIYYLQGLSFAQIEDYNSSFDAFAKMRNDEFQNQRRNRVWHIVCDEHGRPKKFKGRLDDKLYKSEEKKGRLYLDDISKKHSIYYTLANLRLPKAQGVHTDFELGTNYIGFTVLRDAKGGPSHV